MQLILFFFFKQKTAYEMRISDWSLDVCSSDLIGVDRTSQGCAVDPCGPALGPSDALVDGKLPRPPDAHSGAPLPHERAADGQAGEIGRASCRERVRQYV